MTLHLRSLIIIFDSHIHIFTVFSDTAGLIEVKFHICFYFVMRETSCCLFLTIIKQILHLAMHRECLDGLLGVGSPCFTRMVGPMCPTGLR